MNLSKSLFSAITFTAAAASALAVELTSNTKNEKPGRHGSAAMSFDLDRSAVANGLAELQLQLPGGPRAILRRHSFHSRGANSGLWHGAANLRNDSEVLLTLRNGYMAGIIRLGADLYEVRPQGTRHVVEKIDQASFPPCGGQVRGAVAADTTTTTTTTQVTAASTSTGMVTVDLLTLYTPQARVAAGGAPQVEAIIQNAVDLANLTFTNSLVNSSYRLVRVAEAAHNDAGVINTDLTWLQGDPAVASLRNTVGADMVSLIVENGGGYCGMGYIMQSVGPGFASAAFQVTARTCAAGNLSFAHEHGHNLGMEHDPANGNLATSASDPWSFGHLVDGVFRTVMSYASQCPSGCTRVPYFSNPNVTYSGYPTGVVDQRDNARTARQTSPVVATFRAEAPTSPPVAPSALTASPALSTQVNLAWADNSTNEAGFKIDRSSDGVNFAQIASTNAGVNSYNNTGLTGASTFTYRVRAFNAVGDSNPSNDATATTPMPAPPAAPGSLSAAATSASQINLAWGDASNNEAGFRIERSLDGVTFAQIAATGANVTSYSSTALTANTMYYYRVCAYNADGASSYSGPASAKTMPAPLAAPGGFTGTPQFAGASRSKTLTAIALAWADVASNTGYNLERCKQSGKGRTASCVYAPLSTPGADSSAYVDSSAATTGLGTYQYRIRSFDAAGSSAWAVITVNAN